MRTLDGLRGLYSKAMSRTLGIVALLVMLCLQGCGQSGEQQVTFTLPQGDSAVGKQVFVSLQCNSCHSLPGVPLREDSVSGVSVALGGEVRRIKTYSELLTAVVNPSHKILQGFSGKHKTASGQSAMRNYNDVMTVSQLIDLVSYLQTQYKLKDFDRSQYRSFPVNK